MILGYASWLTSDAPGAERPLILRETAEHTGTRVWEAAWLHRSWVLDHPELFQPVSGVQREVIELGSGVGVLGLTVAASHRASVTLSDFSGHFQSGVGASVVHNLWTNCMRNQKLVELQGGNLRVLQLDWSQPSSPQRLPLAPADVEFDTGSVSFELPLPTPSTVVSADVMLATEVLYTEQGAELFADTVAVWLRRPSGTLWLMNNPFRAGCGYEQNSVSTVVSEQGVHRG
jgi:predicted nicotinamide N-methyase